MDMLISYINKCAGKTAAYFFLGGSKCSLHVASIMIC